NCSGMEKIKDSVNQVIKRIKMKFKLSIILLFFSAGIFAQLRPKDLVEIKTFQSFDKVYAGGELKLAVQTDIKESWHINSNKPYDDFLIPTEIRIESENFELVNSAYPPAEDLKLAFSENPLSVWEDQIIIGALIKVKDNVEPGSYNLIVTLNY